LVWRKNKRVSVAFSFLIQSDAATKGIFEKIQRRLIPSEYSINRLNDGSVVVRITRQMQNSEIAIKKNRDDLIEDLNGFGAKFQNWKYHLVGVDGKVKNKSITWASKILYWLTPTSDAKNFQRHNMPFFSVVFILLLGVILLWLV
tara:strand:+ start:130087 stop:130521 length:435 start_codon:yes stop_codon:yes gene_type:complete